MISRINIFTKNKREIFFQPKCFKSNQKVISVTRAFKILNYTRKLRYVEKKIDSYQFNDIAYRLISQHPHMKEIFTSWLKKENDFEELSKWKSLSIGNDLFPKSFPFKDKDGDSLYIETPNYLALPKSVEVMFCSSIEEVENATATVERASEEGFNVVGFDCEWSPYSHNEILSILQVSFNNKCFIIDCLYGDKKTTSNFINKLFSSKNLIKLGKNPYNDLNCLFKMYPEIDILSNPLRTICLTTLINNFNIASSNQPLNDIKSKNIFNIKFFNPNWKEIICKNKNQDINIDINDKRNISGQNEMDVTNYKSNFFKIQKQYKDDVKCFTDSVRGASFSSLCQLILGKSIDKSEQVSVWDKRPLRISQIRYAALDAEANRMIYNKLEKWGNILNVDVKKIALTCKSEKLKPSKTI
ncbi:3'-5' exonuclease domain and Ribonuclease H-like domain-containing protein [Strongyloides ratti]|uniref:3'-5' exonuclease domain and Ribonuclease H-like domain-containing protein n=1 Tax=Strongyloides ratti TaxID=34506 RepID=A0A090MV73_STRRB|nr:3'-5' exonuclease domain and Ribonuclease H-like domain-containing protein [Strongyloides ratti]CEF62688.1 3'-5' exonuclease domain and Ribonuclease H-like domain-containing protein [Strongyloides ratti]